MRLTHCSICLIFFLVLLIVSPGKAGLPTGPDQPPMGPGGAQYPHKDVKKTSIGEFETKCYIYEPDNPRPASAPILLFLHGMFASKPEYYDGWLEHLCKRGWIVIFPHYQGGGESPAHYTANAAVTVKKALRWLNDGNGVEPNRDQAAIIGHEYGGLVAANLAAASRYFKLPVPGVVMILTPAVAAGLELYDLSGIRTGTLLQVVVGEDDLMDTGFPARQIYYAADNIPTVDKSFITLLSDTHGTPALIADRFAPLAPLDPAFVHELDRRRWEFIGLFRKGVHTRAIRGKPIDAMDFFGTWRLFDAMARIKWDGGAREVVFGNTESQRFMGYWSDGNRVRGLLASDRP